MKRYHSRALNSEWYLIKLCQQEAQMTDLQIITKNEILVIDSRLIATELGIQHPSLFRMVKKYCSEIGNFGHLSFEIETVKNSVGAVNQQSYCYLNEDQATFLMTLSKNTPQVIACKINLVKAFSKAKELIKSVSSQTVESSHQLPTRHTAVEYIEASEKLENIKDSRLQRLLRAKLEHELSLQQVNQKLLSQEVENFTTLTVLAHDLGYSSAQIGSGTKLGKFVKSFVPPDFQDYQGQYLVWHYKVTDELKDIIHNFFS